MQLFIVNGCPPIGKNVREAICTLIENQSIGLSPPMPPSNSTPNHNEVRGNLLSLTDYNTVGATWLSSSHTNSNTVLF